MRVQLKHILPLAVLLTGVAAKTTASAETTDAATEKATATDDSASATATGDDSTATGTSDSTATGKDSSTTATGKNKSDTESTGTPTTVHETTDTWSATVQKTTAPDLESSGVSLFGKKPNYIVVTLSVGLLTASMNFL